MEENPQFWARYRSFLHQWRNSLNSLILVKLVGWIWSKIYIDHLLSAPKVGISFWKKQTNTLWSDLKVRRLKTQQLLNCHSTVSNRYIKSIVVGSIYRLHEKRRKISIVASDRCFMIMKCDIRFVCLLKENHFQS